MEQEGRRRVRSFVRRPGRMTRSQTRALEEDWPAYGVEYAPGILDLAAVFGREAPVVLEIGFGNGDTFVEQAAADPERNYLGIEVHEPGVGHCLIRARAAEVTNLRIIAHDAIEVLRDQIPDESLQRVNVYFPDPWPKKRHHKRRLIQPAFLSLVARKLRRDGELCIATDWAGYAEHIDEVLADCDAFRIDLTREHGGDAPIDRPTTKFERRGLGLKHRIRDWRLLRNQAASR
jgi:tRNA (guanine-N7-)-methyltransferase